MSKSSLSILNFLDLNKAEEALTYAFEKVAGCDLFQKRAVGSIPDRNEEEAPGELESDGLEVAPGSAVLTKVLRLHWNRGLLSSVSSASWGPGKGNWCHENHFSVILGLVWNVQPDRV